MKQSLIKMVFVLAVMNFGAFFLPTTPFILKIAAGFVEKADFKIRKGIGVISVDRVDDNKGTITLNKNRSGDDSKSSTIERLPFTINTY